MKHSILILILISSCIPERAARKTNWLKSHGYLSTDSTTVKIKIPKDSSSGQIDFITVFDSIFIKSLDTLYLKDSCPDKKKVQQMANKVAKSVIITPVKDSTNRHELKIWVENGEIKYTLRDNEIEAEGKCPPQVKCPDPSWWHKFLEHWSIGVLSCIIFVFLVKKYS